MFEKVKFIILVLILIGVITNGYLIWSHDTYSTDCTGVWDKVYEISEKLDYIERNTRRY